MVGHAHEAVNFLHLLSDLHFGDPAPVEIVSAFDRFRARAGGKRFSYCPLHLVRMKKPSLDNGLMLVRYRELIQLPPCASLTDCPGIGEPLGGIASAEFQVNGRGTDDSGEAEPIWHVRRSR